MTPRTKQRWPRQQPRKVRQRRPSIHQVFVAALATGETATLLDGVHEEALALFSTCITIYAVQNCVPDI